jgi:hypothetical protein
VYYGRFEQFTVQADAILRNERDGTLINYPLVFNDVMRVRDPTWHEEALSCIVYHPQYFSLRGQGDDGSDDGFAFVMETNSPAQSPRHRRPYGPNEVDGAILETYRASGAYNELLPVFVRLTGLINSRDSQERVRDGLEQLYQEQLARRNSSNANADSNSEFAAFPQLDRRQRDRRLAPPASPSNRGRGGHNRRRRR